MFRHRRQLRRWATQVLLVWLFGVTSGVANACLAPSATPSSGLTFEPPVAVVAPHAHPAAVGSEHRHGADRTLHANVPHPQDLPAKPSCQDFCDKSGISIAPLKSALDATHCDALRPASMAVVLPIPAFSPGPPSAPRREGGGATPPIRLAFSQLAL